MKKINEVNSVVNYNNRVLQFGEGNFLRAFVDWIIDTMNKNSDFNSGVQVVQPLDQGLVEKLNEQDCLYTLYLRGIKNGQAVSESTTINCISNGINPYKEYEKYLELALNPDLRFVISNTTEAGIVFDENDKLEDKPQNSFPGKLTALLYKRYKTFNGDNEKGLILLPCELIDKNGDNLKKVILKLAKLWNLEEGFSKWIEEANTFCNTLVDRIVPGYPRDRMNEIKEELGYEDSLVVEGEQFHLWVIEGPNWIKDEFPAHKYGLNVLVVDDLTPYRTRKVRILNGAHTSMVPVAYLYGLDTVKESVEDDTIGDFVREAIFDEIVKTLDLPEKELEEFANDVIDRFKNPFVKHYLMSISLNSMSKFKTRVLPSIIKYKEIKNELPKKLVFSLAALIAFYKGDRSGSTIDLKDNEDILDLYKNLWENYDGTRSSLEDLVEKVLGYEKNWESNLNEIENLHKEVSDYLEAILQKGMKEAVKAIN